MLAIEVPAFGDASVLALRHVPEPRPAAGEVLIRLDYAGLNFTDIYRRNGQYARSGTYPTPLPLRLGFEGAGRVAEVGDGVTAFAPGDRVAYAMHHGGYAEAVAVPERYVVPLDGDVRTQEAAALLVQAMTAHYLSHDAFPLQSGSVAVVHAAAGGVGQMLVQMAKRRGAYVIATAGSARKADIARARGADAVVLYREQDFREAVMRYTEGRGADVVYDSVGRDTLLKSLNSLRIRGTCVLYGHASGRVLDFDPLELAEAGSVFLTRPHMQHYVNTPADYRRRAAAVLALHRTGELTITIDRVFPLEEAAAAQIHLETGRSRGKVLLRMPAAAGG